MSTHTLGPWTIWHDTHVMGEERLVAACGGYSSNVASERVHDTNIANARLIAAAPEMLEALQAVMGEWREGYGLNCVNQVRAAIAKAEGRS